MPVALRAAIALLLLLVFELPEGIASALADESKPSTASLLAPPDEINGSKAALETELGVPVTEFSYPYGSYNAAAVNMVMLSGYKAARAANFGSLHSADEIYRLSVITAPVDLLGFAKSFPAQ